MSERTGVAPKLIWGCLAVAVTCLGLFLRLEHAWTFDNPHRASDYAVHMQGVQWMQTHWRPFYHSLEVNYQVRSYPPLWYALCALILKYTPNVRALVVLSLLGGALRHTVLWLMLRKALPERPLARLMGLSIHALLPLAILTDGKVNPESFHSGLFALALYALWCVERQGHSRRGISLVTAAAFGAFAAVALLAKVTAGMLLPVGALVFGWQGLLWLRRSGLKTAWSKVAIPALVACGTWWAVAGWWCGTNLDRFGQPFPHSWNLETAATLPVLAEAALYRRPLGWALPFEWTQYWSFPIARNPTNPKPNFWAGEITGTWADYYNRGFCRLPGAGTDYTWGGRHGAMSDGTDVWAVSYRCVDWLAAMLHVGVWITGATVLAVIWCLWQHVRSWGERGSLVLSISPLVGIAAAGWLALAFPYDHQAVLNARYLMSHVMPLSACFAIGVAQLETLGKRPTPWGALARLGMWTLLGLTLCIGCMVLYERFGR